MRGKSVTPEIMESAWLLRTKGLTDKEICGIIGMSYDWCNDFSRIIRLVEAEDAATLKTSYPNRAKLVGWICEKVGKDYDKLMGIPAEPTVRAEKTDNTAQAFVTLLEAVKEQTEAIKELTRVVTGMDGQLSQLRLVVSGFRGDVGERIKGVVEAINYNGDQATKEHDKAIEHLSMIRSQTKKRPWQEGQQ